MLLPRPLHALALLLFAGAPALAGTPIPISDPGTISAPGHYVLMNWIESNTSSVPFIIDARTGPIDLDLNNFGIRVAGLLDALIITGDQPVSVRNGKIQGTPWNGIVAFDSNKITLDEVDIYGDWGIWVRGGSSLTMRHSSARSTVYSLYFQSTGTLSIDHSTIQGGYVAVKVVNAASVKIKNSNIGPGSQGWALDVVHVPLGKLSIGRSFFGWASESCVRIDADGGRFNKNDVGGGQLGGLVITGAGNSIQGNTFHDNAGCGLEVNTTFNIVRGNTFFNNAGGDVCAAP